MTDYGKSIGVVPNNRQNPNTFRQGCSSWRRI